MRQWGRLSLELLFVALLYTAVGVVLGVFSVGWGSPIDVTRLLLQNLLAIIPLVFFIWKADGPWWSVGGTCTLALALLQVVVPRMEMLLERGQTLIQLPVLALNAIGAAAAAVAALMMMLRPWNDGDSMPPYFWPAGAPNSYFWRIPAFVGVFAVLHVLAARLGRIVVRQTPQPAMLGELLAKIFVGGVLVLPVLAVTAHLGVRSRRRLLVLLGAVATLPALGRWQLLSGWPLAYLSARVGFRLAADVGVASAGALLMLAAIAGRGAAAQVAQQVAAGDDPDDSALEADAADPEGARVVTDTAGIDSASATGL
ncbi:MAG TPA: hypothetical protein PLP31_01610 [Thermoanaerobaculaceae bacterium]|nr:hypothetical protein [Thermoanaerobaculaceae bacterium]